MALTTPLVDPKSEIPNLNKSAQLSTSRDGYEGDSLLEAKYKKLKEEHANMKDPPATKVQLADKK
ncbi:hypothetical protein DAPPUDRAFT_329871 [Daphnia pulex]|uniref:Uncharacterized protein n=1 Tax=Daphnia pulex TaxID=6669 RepID=E9HHV7_DAPPU|nr:hypothetical protein DAPPUDRAFT_329871 [Daphnia pulex]|eukprot:EFX68696.1 hypothetical protein DAPPUDRAFT_329871 [Daphnia pulex]